MTSTDKTWAIRVETKGLEPVVTGPLTRDQANALANLYLDRDQDEVAEDGGPTQRRITVEEYDATDPDLEPLIPIGAERVDWFSSAAFLAASVAALLLAYHTYHLTLATPRANDVPIAAFLALMGCGGVFLIVADATSRVWDRFMRQWARSTRRPTEVTS